VVFGGTFGSDYLSSAEVIDFADDKKSCPQIPDYPMALYDITANFYQGQIVACGGFNQGFVSDCFALGPDLTEWTQINSLYNGQNSDSASSIFNDKWVISGGELKEDEIVFYDEDSFSRGPYMPVEKEGHCQLTLDDEHILFVSGFKSEETLLLNWEDEEWTFLEKIPSAPYNPACGIVNNPQCGPEIIAASATKSFIFSMNDLEWREGPLIPDDLDNLATATITGGILAIGGRNSTLGDVNTVYKFDVNAYEWELLPERLIQHRTYAAAVAVPDDFLNCE